jgi:hypothetical protein
MMDGDVGIVVTGQLYGSCERVSLSASFGAMLFEAEEGFK